MAGTLPTHRVDAQDIAPTGNLSRLLQQYRSATTDTNRIKALLQLSNWYLTRAGDDHSNLDSATFLATEAADLSRIRTWPEGREEARFLLAKTAFKEKDWPRLRLLAADCNDSTRVRLALTVMNAHDLLKFVSPSDNDSAHEFLHHILATPTRTRTALGQTQLLVRLAIFYRSRDDSVTGTAPTLNIVDFTRTSGPGNWIEGLHRWLKFHLQADPVAMTALATLSSSPNIADASPRLVPTLRDARVPPTHLPDPILRDARAHPTPRPDPTLLPDSLDPRDTAAAHTIQRMAARAISYEAGTHWHNGQLGLAEKEYRLAIDIARKSPVVEPFPYFAIVEFYLSNGNASRALFYGLEAVTRLQRNGNPGLAFEPWWCLGQINFELNKTSLARGYYDTVIKILDRRDQNPDAWLFKSITQCYLKENDPSGGLAFLRNHVVRGDMGELPYRQLVNGCYADCYFDLGDYARAEPLYLDCYNLGSRINRYNQSLAAFSLGKLYIRTRQYDKARAYLQPLLKPADYYLVPLYIQRDVHLLLYTADSAKGDYLSSMKHLRTQQALNDSLFNIARNSQIQELAFRYETERKDRDLRLQEDHIQLLQNQAQLQHATLQQVRTFRNTLVGASAMLFVILAVLYSRFRTKQRANRMLRLQQHAINNTNRELQRLNRRQQRLLAEKEWLMNEVHHRVKTNLQIVTSLLNMQVAHLNDEFTLHAFGEIGSRIRTLSLIHQRLYREDGNMATINMSDYIHELGVYLLETHDRPTIRIVQHIDPIELNTAQCVPVGLILNEAISNALLFAFPNAATGEETRASAASGAPIIRYPEHPGRHSTGADPTARHSNDPTSRHSSDPNLRHPNDPASRHSNDPNARHSSDPSNLHRDPIDLPIEGIIEITLHLDPGGRITLTIADDGIGLPPGFDPARDSAMGLQLIKTLGEQLDGQTIIENRQAPGTCGLSITVIFQRQESDLKDV